jgi:hypothetical protein
MKKLVITFFCIIAFNSNVKSECHYKFIESKGVTFVAPIYSSTVLYYFDDYEKNAMAQVQWAFDEDATSQCMKVYESQHPEIRLAIPELDFPTLDIEVFQGLKRVSLNVLSQAGGKFHGQTDFIPVNYGAKSELITAIKEKKELITFYGELKVLYEEEKKDVIAKFHCRKDEQKSGVMALHGRLTDLILKINSFNSNEKVNRDSVLEDFLGACVEFKEEESESLVAFARKVNLTNGKIPIYGFVKGYVKESLAPSQASQTSYVEF